MPSPATTSALLLLLTSACFNADDAPADTVTETSGDGDGDGDPSGDGDGDPSGDGDGDLSGDGDGDPSGDGDGDGDPSGDGDGDASCSEAECVCDPAAEGACDEGLYCDEGELVCTAPTCGDSELEPLEQCDDGNLDEGDGCDADCSFTEVLYIDASYQNTCALLEGGRVRCWGANYIGQLGYGYTDNIGDDETPADVGDVMLPVAGAELTMGDSHSCILMDDQNVRCWGGGSNGKLGYANTENIGDDEFPVQIADIMVGDAVLEIDAGGSHTCARLESGTMRCWGLPFSGALGYGNTDTIGDDEHPSVAGDVPVGAAVIAQATGISHTCAITVPGKIRCWGAGSSGKLGYGNTDTIGTLTTPAQAGDISAVPLGLPDNTAATALALGLSMTCALYETGDVLCWGSGFWGQTGQGNQDFTGDDELPSTLAPIDLPEPAIAITAGDNHVCALLETREVFCWGQNSVGQLGYGNTNNVGDDELPVSVDPLLFDGPVRQVDAGGQHTCAVMEDTNEVFCWGANEVGQLGYGMTENIGDDESPFAAGPVVIF